ncbi:MAG TPA: hypothetical protein VIV40_33550, partial [Kofleriaceae bacterium]
MATFAMALLGRDLKRAAQAPSPQRQTLAAVGSTLAVAAGYVGLAVGTLVWWPTPLIAAAAGAGVGTIALLRRRPAIAAIDPLDVACAETAVTRSGVAHRLVETQASITEQSNVLAEQAVVASRKGLLFRRVRAVPFVVELDDGGKLVVLGTLRVETAPGAPIDVKPGDPALLALGIDGRKVAGQLTVATVREGERVTVTGEESSEIVGELAFHRDGGEATV